MGKGIVIHTYDFEKSSYNNLVDNFMAERLSLNRWGKKFAKLYKKHQDASPVPGTIGDYDFTAGMRASVKTLPQAQAELNREVAFNHNIQNTVNGTDFPTLGYFSVFVTVVIDSTVLGTTIYRVNGYNAFIAVEGDDDTDSNALFGNIQGELSYFISEYAALKVTGGVGEQRELKVSYAEFMSWLGDRDHVLHKALTDLNNVGRAKDDLELIKHLQLEDTLSEEISKPSDIETMFFKFKKPLATGHVIDDGNGNKILDPNYKWWEEEQFQGEWVDKPDKEDGTPRTKKAWSPGIADKVKKFQDYCVVEVVGTKAFVRVKADVFDRPGYKIYHFVTAFLNIKVKAKEKSWFEKLLGFFLLIVGIALTVMTENPIWLKYLLVSTQILNYLGILSPKVSLLVALVSFGYGISNVNFSAMSSMQIFKWAVNNVEMVYKLAGIYESIEVQKDMKEKAKEQDKDKSLAQMQDDTIEFLYTDAYTQYDKLYESMYDFDPPRKHLMN